MTSARLLAGAYWAAVAALLLPLALVAAGSLADGTLGPYAAAVRDREVREAFGRSVLLALAAGGLSVLAGGAVALAVPALPRPWMRAALLGGALLPLLTPGIVHAVALRVALAAAGLPPGPAAVLLGHVVHAAPVAALMVGARRATLPPGLLDAARDLGAGPWACFRLVELPWLRPALLGAGALAALASFDDFVRSLFLGGYDPTLPVLLFARLRGGFTPELDAVATLVLLLALLAGWAAGMRLPARGDH